MHLLTEIETRVLGSLIEKDITTPDYYPLSLNALVNACNQKNNRDPVMTLDESAVRAALTTLQEKRMAGPAGGADSRVTKYEHRLQEVFNFDRRETAIVCVLLLRGPQTPGELRGRTDRMYHFDSPRRRSLDARSPGATRAATGVHSRSPARHEGISLHAFVLRRTAGADRFPRRTRAGVSSFSHTGDLRTSSPAARATPRSARRRGFPSPRRPY